MHKASDITKDTSSAQRATAMNAMPSNSASLTSNARQDAAMGNSSASGVSESPSDDEFVHIQLIPLQKGTAMQALSSILDSVEGHSSIDGDWVALSSPTMKVQALGDSESPSDSSKDNPADAAVKYYAGSKIFSYDKLRTTSTDCAPGIDPTKRETYLSEAEFRSLFGMSKTKFYALPKWKQAQRKQDLDLF